MDRRREVNDTNARNTVRDTRRMARNGAAAGHYGAQPARQADAKLGSGGQTAVIQNQQSPTQALEPFSEIGNLTWRTANVGNVSNTFELYVKHLKCV